MQENILSFEKFANGKEDLLTAQSETLAAEMSKLEEQMTEKLKVLEDQLDAKQDEEERLRLELQHRKENSVSK